MALRRDVAFTAEDGISLDGTLFEPDLQPGVIPICVLINSATGAPRSYYENFCIFLSEHGFAVLTYDYRGLFNSRQNREKDHLITIRNWGERDTEAALQFLHLAYPDSALTFIGHSIGGTLLGLAPSNTLIQSAIAIASPSGHWRHSPFPAKLFPYFVYTIFVPFIVALTGHLPATFLGIALPRGIVMEWARWCSYPAFVVDENGRALHDGFARYRGPYLFYSTIDDIFAPPDSVRALGALFKNASVEYKIVTARQWGLKAIGHFGFFRKTAPTEFWQSLAEKLQMDVNG